MAEPHQHRPRPREETSGSSQRPPERLAAPMLAFALPEEAERLRQEASWQRGDRNARTLVKESGLRVTLVALKAGARIAQHKAPGRLTIQTVSGHLRCQAAGTDIDLPAGHVLALEQNVSHEVDAIEESVFLLTIASPPDDPNAG
jgi:quercetin dioxygenase-like cupin family protein